MKTAGRDINLEQVACNALPPRLHLDYDLDFRARRVNDIAPTLTSPLLSGLVGDISQLKKPRIPRKPVSLKVEEGLWGRGGAPAKPDAPDPSLNGGMVPQMQTSEVEAKENKPHEQGENDPDQTLLEPDPEEVAAVVISDDDEADLPIDMPQAASTPKSEPVLSQKRPLKDRSPHSALSSFASTGVPWLTAVVPLKCSVGTDKEFLLSNFHRHGCLVRQLFDLGGRCRQLAFCLYCGVINENSDTALSHVRKHLDLHFVCGGCYSKSFLSGPALHRHMRTQCPSVMAIRDQSRTSRR